jgi:hypothetical protein
VWSPLVVVGSVVYDDVARFVQQGALIQGHFFSKGTMDPFIALIRLGVIRMSAHVGRPRGLDEMRPLTPDELRATIMDNW